MIDINYESLQSFLSCCFNIKLFRSVKTAFYLSVRSQSVHQNTGKETGSGSVYPEHKKSSAYSRGRNSHAPHRAGHEPYPKRRGPASGRCFHRRSDTDRCKRYNLPLFSNSVFGTFPQSFSQCAHKGNQSDFSQMCGTFKKRPCRSYCCQSSQPLSRNRSIIGENQKFPGCLYRRRTVHRAERPKTCPFRQLTGIRS